MNSILSKTNINVEDNTQWLKNLQAGIIKGHGRNYTALCFLQFNENDIFSVKNNISKLEITSALDQAVQILNYKVDDKHDEPIINFYISSFGYKKLDVAIVSPSNSFNLGLKNREPFLNGNPEKWESKYKSESIDGMISIACNQKLKINDLIKKYKVAFKKTIKIIKTEHGHAIKNENNRNIEHFGYVDGISQPKFFNSETVNNYQQNFNESAPLKLVLVEDFGIRNENCFGSFMVFRKLEQDVHKFKKMEEQLAKILKLSKKTEEMAGAMIIGRFENGLPILKLGTQTDFEVDSQDNDFNYKLDSQGLKCPFQAHIRKTNPRGESEQFQLETINEERSHMIVRRGITYGSRNFKKEKLAASYPSKGVGLLFICFQSDIENQFEFMQNNWANNNDFPTSFTGIDPIIGQGFIRKNNSNQIIEQTWTDPERKKHILALTNFVKMLGGEYFFAPSVEYIKSL